MPWIANSEAVLQKACIHLQTPNQRAKGVFPTPVAVPDIPHRLSILNSFLAAIYTVEKVLLPTKSFVKIRITKIFCHNNKMFSSINKTFGCCSKIFGCSNKIFICSPQFRCRNKTIFFPVHSFNIYALSWSSERSELSLAIYWNRFSYEQALSAATLSIIAHKITADCDALCFRTNNISTARRSTILHQIPNFYNCSHSSLVGMPLIK